MQALGRTAARRPDLIARLTLSADDRRLLAEYREYEAARGLRDAGDGTPRSRDGADDKAGTTSARPTSLPRTSERKEEA
jgi:hypothetical protein